MLAGVGEVPDVLVNVGGAVASSVNSVSEAPARVGKSPEVICLGDGVAQRLVKELVDLRCGQTGRKVLRSLSCHCVTDGLGCEACFASLAQAEGDVVDVE